MHVPSIVGAISVMVLAAALGCGPKQVVHDQSVSPSWASLWPQGEPIDTVTVAFFDDETEDAFSSPPPGGNGPAVRFIGARGADPRGLLETSSEIDLFVLRDRAAIDYAASLGRFLDVPLAPSRVYVLVSVTRARSVDEGDLLPLLPSPVASGLASDAVRSAYANSISSREWEFVLGPCESTSGFAATIAPPASRRILYDASDPIARDLADRIASLAHDPSSSSASAMAAAVPGLAPDGAVISVAATHREFAVGLTKGSDFAYVVALPYRASGGCQTSDELRNRAPWLMGVGSLSQKVLPLVKTRCVVLALKRADGFGFDIEPDSAGSFRVIRAGTSPSP